MRFVYIISAYKYPDQLIRLVERLNTDSTTFLIHVDKKTDDQVYRQMVNGLTHLANVCFLKRHRCDWGGFGHVAATLEGIGVLVRGEVNFDYAILLTGQDYPIKSNCYIDEFFRTHKGQLFLEYFPLPRDEWQNGGMDRIEAWHWHVLNRYVRFAPGPRFPLKRKLPRSFRPFGGGAYWCLTRECIQYIRAFIGRNPSFVNFFKSVEVPDEIFFQTIIFNSVFAHMAVNDDLRYIEWNDPNSGSPDILRTGDLDKLLASSKLFARKFDVSVDAQVLDFIDQKLLIPA